MDSDSIRQRMQKTLSFLREELAQIKTGRATPALIEKIMIDAYETKMPLLELATINAPDPNELIVAPYDQTILKDIERAIVLRKDIGLSPAVDGQIIRIKIAPLTSERREELIRVISQKLEAARVAIRQIRHEGRSEIKTAAEEGEMNEDERHNQEEKLQEITDEINGEIEQIGKSKEAEIRGGN